MAGKWLERNSELKEVGSRDVWIKYRMVFPYVVTRAERFVKGIFVKGIFCTAKLCERISQRRGNMEYKEVESSNIAGSYTVMQGSHLTVEKIRRKTLDGLETTTGDESPNKLRSSRWCCSERGRIHNW